MKNTLWQSLRSNDFSKWAAEFWLARQPRERQFLQALGVLLVLLLVWWYLLQPALKIWRNQEHLQATILLEQQQMQAMEAESKALRIALEERKSGAGSAEERFPRIVGKINAHLAAKNQKIEIRILQSERQIEIKFTEMQGLTLAKLLLFSREELHLLPIEAQFNKIEQGTAANLANKNASSPAPQFSRHNFWSGNVKFQVF